MNIIDDDDEDRLMNPGEVRRMFGVTPRTVSRWATTGKLTAIKTLGGHRRFRVSDVRALLEDQPGRAGPPVERSADPSTTGRARGAEGRREA